jgi:hypothetical protein
MVDVSLAMMSIVLGAHSINDDGVVFCHGYFRMLNNSPPLEVQCRKV